MRLATQINSISGLCLTKLDVLDGMERLKVCVGYRDAPSNSPAVESYGRLRPLYEELPGWRESTRGVRSVEELPANARAYIAFIEETVGAPVDIISTSPRPGRHHRAAPAIRVKEASLQSRSRRARNNNGDSGVERYHEAGARSSISYSIRRLSRSVATVMVSPPR